MRTSSLEGAHRKMRWEMSSLQAQPSSSCSSSSSSWYSARLDKAAVLRTMASTCKQTCSARAMLLQ